MTDNDWNDAVASAIAENVKNRIFMEIADGALPESIDIGAIVDEEIDRVASLLKELAEELKEWAEG